MWLVVSAIAALISTKAWIDKPGKNYYAQLSMGLWALTAMIFVDHVIVGSLKALKEISLR